MKTPTDVLDHLTYRVDPYSDDPEDVPLLLSSIEGYAKLAIKYDMDSDEPKSVVEAELTSIIECAAQALALLS